MEPQTVTEVWAALPTSLTLSKYEVSSLGRIRNKKTQVLASDECINANGYIVNSVVHNGCKNRILEARHHLIASAFIPNPAGLRYVIHHNDVKTDNRVQNLRWYGGRGQTDYYKDTDGKHMGTAFLLCQTDLDDAMITVWNSVKTAAEQNNTTSHRITHAIHNSTPIDGHNWKYRMVTMPNEKWHPLRLGGINGETVLVSNEGRIRLDTLVTYGIYTNKGFYISIGTANYWVDKLVCRAFHGAPEVDRDHVIHLDSILTNNNVVNLRWAPKPTNNSVEAKRAFTCNKPIASVAEDGQIIQVFESLTKAEEEIAKIDGMANRGNIGKAATIAKKNGERRKACNRYWAYLDPKDHTKLLPIRGFITKSMKRAPEIEAELDAEPELHPNDITSGLVMDNILDEDVEYTAAPETRNNDVGIPDIEDLWSGSTDDPLDVPLYADQDGNPLDETAIKNLDLPGEIWKQLPEKLKLSRYEVSNLGRIRHIKLGVANGKLSHTGYWYSYLSFDSGKSHNRLHHRLVAYAFLDNPEGKPVVDHIDRNKQNNHVDNLRWATYSENSYNTLGSSGNRGRKVIRINPRTQERKQFNSVKEAAQASGCSCHTITNALRGIVGKNAMYKWEPVLEEDLEGEVWIDTCYGGVNLKVSNKGRVKNLRGKMLKQGLNGDYMKVTVGKKSTSVHKVICSAFHGNPPTLEQNTVNHKDHDTTNNTADNLEWASMAEQIAHQRKSENNHSTGKKVIQYNLDTDVAIREWPSVKNACETLGLTRDSVYKVVAYGMPSTNGSGWRYA
jgi:hypothetical protein